MNFRTCTYTYTLLLVWILFSSGCATVFGSKHNYLKFNAESEGQTAEVWLDGVKVGEAPGRIKLKARRIQDGSILELRAEGSETQTYPLTRKLHKGYLWLDIGLSLGFAVGVDVASGYIYRPYPRKIDYQLIGKKDNP